MSSFSKIRIVLLNTSHAGNIGAAARAMKVMGLSRLYLVNPKTFPSAEATSRASGADDLLANAIVCESISEAIHDCQVVYGMTARERTLDWPALNPRACVNRILADDDEVAIVFGNEQSGMSNAEIDHCHFLVNIPANKAYSSLNLAAAVQVMCYELNMTAHEAKPAEIKEPRDQLATVDQVARYYEHLETSLVRTGFLNKENPRHLMSRIRRLYNRIQLEEREVQILRGILTATDKIKPDE